MVLAVATAATSLGAWALQGAIAARPQITTLTPGVALFGALFGVGALFLLFYVCSLVVRQVRGAVFGMGEDDEQQAEIREKGVDAWEFVVDLDVNAMLQSKTEVLFMGGENCVQTNLPLPKINSVTTLNREAGGRQHVDWPGHQAVPAWRMTGWNKYSPRSGVVWFTRNGRRYKAISSGMLYDVFPTISADGPCSFSANFGQRGFVFIEANVKRWGFGPIEGAMLPPPIYGANQNTILLETAVASSESEDDDGGSDESESISVSTPELTAVLEDSVAIDISSTAASVEALVPHPSSSRRQRRRQPASRGGGTSLEPVVTYRNKQPDILHSQDSESMGFDAAGQFA
ncbi:hypothetical protein BX661DRAFT_169751 [Kickxella alabastrina]|uniref:uncharacterized protein n=1 Tax=Kickxella alabastrina TaxID=61397 RepID=UPI0022207D3D|nr:uncharacterized protein BX661DRAFT_169751 [Kickxella alabastrina]KAI7831892.1 hypothetical protein BX661DRAFT_169751 [Kickxella alabastrina]